MPLTVPKYYTPQTEEEKEEIESKRKRRTFWLGTGEALALGEKEKTERQKAASLDAISRLKYYTPQTEEEKEKIESKRKRRTFWLGTGEALALGEKEKTERQKAASLDAISRFKGGGIEGMGGEKPDLAQFREEMFAGGLSEQPQMAAFLGEQERLAGEETEGLRMESEAAREEEYRKGMGQLFEKHREKSDIHADLGNLLANTGDPEQLKAYLKEYLTDLEARETGTTKFGRDVEMQKLKGVQGAEQAKLIAYGQKEDVKYGKKREAATAEMNVRFTKVESLFKKLWQRKQESLSEGGVLEGAGPIKGRIKKLSADLKIPGFELTGAYEGQMFETALTLNSILTNQNRVIEGVLSHIITTLPDINDTETYSRAKIDQSIRNSFGIVKAMERAGLMEDIEEASDEALKDGGSKINQKIKSLTPAILDEQEEAEVNKIIQRVLGEEEEETGFRDYGSEYGF